MDKLLDVEGSNVTRVSERLLVRRREKGTAQASQHGSHALSASHTGSLGFG